MSSSKILRWGQLPVWPLKKIWPLPNVGGNLQTWAWGVREKRCELFREALKELNIGLENRLKVDTTVCNVSFDLVMAALVKPKLASGWTWPWQRSIPKTSEMVMELTQRSWKAMICGILMITHDMNHAIEYGNRLIMLYQGKIVVDVKGEEKKDLNGWRFNAPLPTKTVVKPWLVMNWY